MKAIRFSLYYFDLVVNAFYFASVDRVITMVDNAIPMSLDHLGKGG
jgi:hypothetical protein